VEALQIIQIKSGLVTPQLQSFKLFTLMLETGQREHNV